MHSAGTLCRDTCCSHQVTQQGVSACHLGTRADVLAARDKERAPFFVSSSHQRRDRRGVSASVHPPLLPPRACPPPPPPPLPLPFVGALSTMHLPLPPRRACLHSSPTCCPPLGRPRPERCCPGAAGQRRETSRMCMRRCFFCVCMRRCFLCAVRKGDEHEPAGLCAPTYVGWHNRWHGSTIMKHATPQQCNWTLLRALLHPHS